ncbi:hypothetical protein FOZ63_023380 [Perkinsus olseni]|uniref:Uncharacterized protein n=1 Tax=Perkinsus olseni TaxID=32597 RepID=A0A7J6NU42_PEROL|nr:hypothetical protein FOZ60_005068 [Perkinsus olseni]KAF4724458.1 hypothetical protein FOZ63_023380 [Perkinsus olseni]
MTTLLIFIALLLGAHAGIFEGYTLPGDEDYWASAETLADSTTALTTTPSFTYVATSTESSLQQLLKLDIPVNRGVPTTVEPLSLEEKLEDLEIRPFRGFTTRPPTTSSPTPPTTKSVLGQLLELRIPIHGDISPGADNTTAPPPGNLRAAGLTSHSSAVSVWWLAITQILIIIR